VVADAAAGWGRPWPSRRRRLLEEVTWSAMPNQSVDSRDASKAGMEEEDNEVGEGCLGVSVPFFREEEAVCGLVSSHGGGARSAPVKGMAQRRWDERAGYNAYN
jgi:hypothetical protein